MLHNTKVHLQRTIWSSALGSVSCLITHFNLISRDLLLVQDTLASLHLSLMRDLIQPILQIMTGIALLRGAHDNPRRVVEQVIHFFERAARCFWQEDPEEDGIRQVAEDEEVVEFPADIGHRNWRDLTDHCVEREAGHRGDGNTLTSGPGVEHFGGDDPAERTARTAEAEVIQPGHDLENRLNEITHETEMKRSQSVLHEEKIA